MRTDFPDNTTLARSVVTDPAAFHDQPAVLAAQWATLVEARGGTFHADRLGPPAHRVVPDVIYPLEGAHSPETMARVATRARAHATRRGYPLPTADEAAR